MTNPRIIVALDYAEAAAALAVARRLDPQRCRVKVGKELFTAAGPDLVRQLQALGFGVFLDLKFHDIPNTAAQGGLPRPLLIAVTVLTSLGAGDLAAVGIAATPEDQVLRLAKLTQASGLDGVVCSAREAPALRKVCGANFKLVTPGIRPAGTDANDQVRVMTPEAAVAAGADYLVVGRAITGAPDPAAALDAINASIGAKG